MLDMKSIGNRIKQRRIQLNLSQTDIYEKCQITSGALSKIENGKAVPSVITFYKLSEILRCDMNWLLTGSSYGKQDGDTVDSSYKKQNDNIDDNEDFDYTQILIDRLLSDEPEPDEPLKMYEIMLLDKLRLFNDAERDEVKNFVNYILYKKDKKARAMINEEMVKRIKQAMLDNNIDFIF